MPRHPIVPAFNKDNPRIKRIADEVEKEVRSRVGPNSTFEERRRIAAEVLHEVGWTDEEKDLCGLVSNASAVEVEGTRYVRLSQNSSVTIFGCYGGHRIDEALYRESGKHNGSTIKPLQLRVGAVENMTPDFAHIVGELAAHHSSRILDTILEITGFVAPSRAFLEKHIHGMAQEVFANVEEMEDWARATTELGQDVAAVSCGLDRWAVRMVEPAQGDSSPPRTRSEPYVRQPPPAHDHVYRMSRAASVTTYNAAGVALQTLYYALDAGSEQMGLVKRVVKDVQWIVEACGLARVECIQDGAPELLMLPQVLRELLPDDVAVIESVDFEHTLGYIEDVVDAFTPAPEQESQKRHYRQMLLSDDAAIDTISEHFGKLEMDIATQPTTVATENQHEVLAAALRYVGKRADLNL